MHHVHFSTPVGTLLLTWNSRSALARVDWLPLQADVPSLAPMAAALPAEAAESLEAIRQYFLTGEPMGGDSPSSWLREGRIDTASWSDFQKQVYAAVMTIPHGETRTYAWVANRIRMPGASRAVGQALRRNSHLVIVPCHRVVSRQDIGGFMGADDPDAPELIFKQRLLAWEHSWRNPTFSFLTA